MAALIININRSEKANNVFSLDEQYQNVCLAPQRIPYGPQRQFGLFTMYHEQLFTKIKPIASKHFKHTVLSNTEEQPAKINLKMKYLVFQKIN